MDRRDASWTVAEPLGLLEAGRKRTSYFSYPLLELEGSCNTYTVVGSDGSHVTRGFCPNCGSPILSYVAEVPAVTFIKAGSLDDPSWVRAESSYWNRSARDWSPVDERIPSFAGNPPAS